MLQRNFQPVDEPSETSDSLDFKKIFSTLLERIWLIIACLIVCGVASVIYLNRAPRIYAATTIVKVDLNQPKVLDLTMVQEDYRGVLLEPKLKEIRQTLVSRSLLSQVVETNNLARDPRFVGPDPARVGNTARLARRLERMITVGIPKDYSIVTVTVENESPELAAQLANSLATELILHSSKSQEEITRMAEAKLGEMLHTLRQEWKQYETNLQPYQDESAYISSRRSDMGQSLSDLNQKLIEAMLRRISLETEYAQVERLGPNVEALLKLPLINADPAVAAVRIRLVEREASFSNVKQRYKEKHPKYSEAENELASIRRVLTNDVLSATQSIKSAIENAKAMEKELQKKFGEERTLAQELSKKAIASTNNVLVREIELQRTIHDKVMQRLKEASMTGDLFYNPIRIFQLADVPLRPVKPEKMKVLLIGLVGGLAAGLALALALGLVDTTLKSLDDAEHFLDLPVLTTIPHVRALKSASSRMVMNDDDVLSGAESFRSLRTSISVLSRDKELRCILFTSALPEEGKTFCAVNYSVSLAQQGLKTVLIECDLRRPKAHLSFSGLKKDALGLTDYLSSLPVEAEPRPAPRTTRSDASLSFAELRTKQRGETPAVTENPASRLLASSVSAGQVEAKQIAQKTEIENLWMITAGTVTSNLSELLSRQGMNYLLADLLLRYDRIVIDSAPIFGISDTLLLTNRVHGLCLVIRANRTPRKAVRRAVEMLRRVEAPVMGVALNGLTSNRMGGYGDPYYDYGYVSKKGDQNG